MEFYSSCFNYRLLSIYLGYFVCPHIGFKIYFKIIYRRCYSVRSLTKCIMHKVREKNYSYDTEETATIIESKYRQIWPKTIATQKNLSQMEHL